MHQAEQHFFFKDCFDTAQQFCLYLEFEKYLNSLRLQKIRAYGNPILSAAYLQILIRNFWKYFVFFLLWGSRKLEKREEAEAVAAKSSLLVSGCF